MEVFWPWYCYSWTHDEENIAVEYMIENYVFLSEIEKMFIGSCIRNQYSFYEVKKVQYGQHLVLKDLITNKEHFVFETRTSLKLESGNILLAKIAEVMDLKFLAAGSQIISSKFRSRIKKEAKQMKNSELYRIDFYFEILEEILIEDMKIYEV